MPIQQTAEMTQPEMAFSDAHSPVYYTGKTKAAIPHFKRSVNYLKFKQEYEQSIQSIIDFYNQHAPNLGQDEITTDLPESLRKKSTVENMFMQFKMALFDVKNFDRLHHLYQAKRPIEEIAQSLQEEGSIPTVTKLDEIRELARKIMMCGSGVHSHIIGTKLSLTGSSGELSDNFSAYKNTIAHAVITESTSRHFINPFYEIHVFNEYWNHFSKILGIASIEDKSYANFFTNGADIQACQNALQQALTPFNITDKLATDHWNNLRSVIGDATEWGQINDILAGLKSSYKPINVYSLIEESVDSPDKYRLRQDKTWLQVEIARQLSLLPSQISWLNWTPIAVEGNRLLRIGDLFWQEIDGELSPPKIEDLVGYAGQVAYAQLIDGIARAKEQDAIWLSELDPQYLQVTNTKDIALFLSKLGDERFIRYAMNNLNWFKKLTVPAPLLIKTLSKISDGEVANIDTGFLYSMSLKEIKKFFEYWESNAIKPGSGLLKKVYQQTRRTVTAVTDADYFMWEKGILVKGDKSPLYGHIMGQLLNYAIDITDDLLINKLLNENNIHLKQTDHEGKDNPLVRALDKNLSWMIIPKLLSKHNWQAYQPSDKYNLLYYPIKNKNLTTLQLLLNAGADPNQYLKPDRSVLQQAVLSGEPGWVEILLEYDAKDNTGDALKAAIRQGNVEMVAQLSAIARPIDHLISLYPSLLSLARSLPTSSSERIIDILKFQINEKQLKQPLFDQIMSVAAMKEMAYIPFKPVGRLYQAILNSLDRLHRTSDSEKITTAFKLKIQIAHYKETNPRKDRRQEAFLILDEEINTALFTPETTTSSIKIIIDFAKNDLPFVIDLYQWVSSHSMQASINFLIDKLKKQPNPAAHFNEIKNIYSGATYLTYPLTIDQWDSKYSGAARNELNRQFSENPAPISVALRQEGQGLLFGYRDDTHYQKSLECIQLYMPSLKKKGVTTICLPLNKAEEQSITSYMKPPGGTRDISTLINLNTALKHLCIEASLRDMKIIALMPEDPPDNTLQRVLSDQSIVTKLNDLSAQLPSDEKFIALYSHPRLLSQKLKNGFLPGIALRLGLPALEVSRYRLSLLDDLPYRSQNQAQPWAKTRTHLRGPADQPHFGPQSVSSFHSVEETRPRYAYEIAVINPHDTNALWAAGKWLKEDLERRYLIGMDGEHFNLYSPNGHPADVPQEALQAFRTALTSIPNKSIRLLFVGEKLRLPPTTEFSAATAQWNGQSLDGIRERISDFINKNLTGLRVENIQVVLGQIIVITDLDANNQPLPVHTEVTVDYLAPLRSAASNMHVEPLLQQYHTIIPTGLRGGNAEYSDAIEPIQLVAQRRLPPHSPEVITSADKKLIVKVAKVQRKFPLQELTRQHSGR